MNKHLVKPVAKYIPGTSARSSKRSRTSAKTEKQTENITQNPDNSNENLKTENVEKIPEFI